MAKEKKPDSNQGQQKSKNFSDPKTEKRRLDEGLNTIKNKDSYGSQKGSGGDDVGPGFKKKN